MIDFGVMKAGLVHFAMLLLALVLTGSTVRANELEDFMMPAENLTDMLQVTASGGQDKGKITDNSVYTFESFGEGDSLTLECDREIGGIYIMWNKLPEAWSGEADGAPFSGGEKGFLHEYLKLESPARRVVIHVPKDGQITDIYAFSQGELPQWVQVWDEPYAQADLLLFSTHSDDEQLFFAGILPYYTLERKVRVQVVYGTHHWRKLTRPHELLNGLWTVGVRHYPVISPFPDDARSLGSAAESRETVLERARRVYDEAEWVRFEVEILRRFRPQVVVNHDINGEYRHGAHILNTDALMQAIELSGDASYDPESAKRYGVWDAPKVYLHLYGQNKLVMDWDVPYESMGGKTPFEMSKAGYACHISQQDSWFTRWINKAKAADIKQYSPCEYGLYRTMVGEDVKKNDLLENIVTYDEQERLAREERERAEQERLAREERERAEQERLAREERERAEQERLAEEERERAEQEKQERLAREERAWVLKGIFWLALAVVVAGFMLLRHNRRRH